VKYSNWLPVLFVVLALASPLPAADQETRNTLARANIEYRQLKYAEALKLYDSALQSDASYAAAHNNRGLALHKLARLEEAIAALQRAIEIDSSRAPFHLNLGKVYATAGQYDSALRSLKQAQKIDPSLAAAVFNEAWVLEAMGQKAAASVALSRLKSAARRPPSADILAGIIRTGLGDPEAASAFDGPAQPWSWLGEINRALVLGGAADMPPKARAALRRAILAFSCEQFAEARQLLAVVADESPTSPLPHWLAAMAWQSQGQSDMAQAAMKRAQPLLPSLSVERGIRPTVVFLDGQNLGCPPVRTTVLPAVHGVQVISKGENGYLLASRCWRFLPAEDYRLPPAGSFPYVRQDGLPAPNSLTFAQNQLLRRQLSQPVYLRSDFERDLEPWDAERTGDKSWHIEREGGAEGLACAGVTGPWFSSFTGTIDTSLNSPVLDFTGYRKPVLIFKYRIEGSSSGVILTVETRTRPSSKSDDEFWTTGRSDDSAFKSDWTRLVSKRGRLPSEWSEQSVELASYAGTPLQLRFHLFKRSDAVFRGCFVDSVTITVLAQDPTRESG